MKKGPQTKAILAEMYDALVARFGHRGWWPGDSPFEVCVGAILTQNTAWKNVAKAIENLKAAEALDPFVLHSMPEEDLAKLIRPAGYYNVKARRLKNLLGLIVEQYGGDLDSLFSLPSDELRIRLLSVNGVGFETADSIILYAAGKPIFVIDAYTGRVLKRHGLVDQQADYATMQKFFHRLLPRNTDLYNDFHAQIVAVGHHYCKKKPLCEECPLAGYLTDR